MKANKKDKNGRVIDLIIFSGQSNMQGQTERLSDAEPVEGAWEYRLLTDELVPLRDPAGEDIRYDGTPGYAYEDYMGMTWHEANALGSAAYGHTTLLPAFARAYVETTGRELAAVHAAKGATDLSYWLPGTPGFTAVVNKTLKARSKLVNSGFQLGHVFLVWLQGESDAIISKPRDKYIEELSQVNAGFKAEFGLEKFGIIRVGRFTCDQRDLEIMAAQDEICKNDPDFLMLTDIAADLYNDPESMNPFVGGHFSAFGLEKLGKAAGKTLGIKMANGKWQMANYGMIY